MKASRIVVALVAASLAAPAFAEKCTECTMEPIVVKGNPPKKQAPVGDEITVILRPAPAKDVGPSHGAMPGGKAGAVPDYFRPHAGAPRSDAHKAELPAVQSRSLAPAHGAPALGRR